jgi:hypothetical protein
MLPIDFIALSRYKQPLEGRILRIDFVVCRLSEATIIPL